MRKTILEFLKYADGPVSGQAMGARLGVSRTTVWKHVGALRNMGYPVVSESGGYRLEDSRDVMCAWEFPGREDRIRYFPETRSTMDEARDLARTGAPHGTVVVAGRQTAGRGRLDRQWISDEGGLYFTLILRPALPLAEVSRILFAASVAMSDVIREVAGAPARVKWPNDILVDDAKVVGMLSEVHAVGETVEYLNLGIGVNVNNDTEGVEPRAASLGELAGRRFSRKDVLGWFLDRFEPLLETRSQAGIMAAWRERAGTLGRAVRVRTVRETLEGIARDVDEDGALVLELPDGTVRRISYGDCFHR
ncbi:MAG: biotin--[acetyl-CoA-carboxylase] ligase [Desulfatibacillaceae bacterium]